MDTALSKPLTKKDFDKLIENIKNIRYEQPYWIITQTKDENKYLLVNNYNSPYPMTEIRRILYD